MAAKKRGEMLEQTEIKIPFEHLSPAAQAIIGEKKPGTIKTARMFRAVSELIVPFATAGGLAIHQAINTGKRLGAGAIVGSVLGSLAVLVAYRSKHSKMIQQAHEELKRAINKHGVLHTSFEGHYPFNWINPTQIARTHPVFYVTGRGDVVFKKNTRLEYMRHLDQ